MIICYFFAGMWFDILLERDIIGNFGMYIDLTQLEGQELHVEHCYDSGFDLNDPNLRLVEGPVVQLHLKWAAGKEVCVRGSLQTKVNVTCDRCLEYFGFPLDVTFDLFYAPIEILTSEEDVPLMPKDLTYAFYKKNLIDVDGLVREQILLALPFRRLCQSDCRGLCSSCGINLNQEQCACEEKSVAATWSALRDLKKPIQ